MDKKRINKLAYELYQSTSKIQCEKSVMIGLIKQLYDEIENDKSKQIKFIETEPKEITLEFKIKSGKKVKFNAVEVVKTKIKRSKP